MKLFHFQCVGLTLAPDGHCFCPGCPSQDILSHTLIPQLQFTRTPDTSQIKTNIDTTMNGVLSGPAAILQTTRNLLLEKLVLSPTNAIPKSEIKQKYLDFCFPSESVVSLILLWGI